MAVPEQTPYKEYTANGVTTSFPLEFDCDNQDHLIVTVNDIEPENGQWSLINGAVVFLLAPANQAKIIIQRNTPLERNTDYQTYNNSFRPQPVNKDFDRIWWKLQELGYRDQVIWLALVKEIADRIAGDDNLQNQINTIDEWLDNLQQNVNENTSDIAQLVTDLSKEIADRITGDQILKDMFLSMIDEAINEGTINALAITHVDSLEALDAISNVWDGRTIYVKDIGMFEYDALRSDWIALDKDIVRTVESIADLIGLEKWDGRAVRTKGYHKATNFALAQPYVGGATYIYNAENNQWDYISTDGIVDVCQFGADPNRVLDSTQAFKDAVQYCCLSRIKDLHVQSGIYIISDTIYMTEVDTLGNPLRRDQGVTIRGSGRYNTSILFKASHENQVLFDTYSVSAVDNNRCIYGVSIRPFTDAEDINNPAYIVDSSYLHMGIGINAREVCGSFYEDIDIKGLYAGIQWTCGNGDPISYTGNDISDASRGWCEFNRFNNINLWMNKIGVLIYGGGSYHGNSLKNTKIQGMEEWMWQRLGQSTGTCYGIKAIAGINTNRLPDPYWQLCNIYNVNMEINFFGNASPNYKFIAISVDKARTFAQTGGFMSHEGNIYFEAKNDGWWTFDGDINGYNLKLLTDESQNNELPFGNFAFRNWSSNLIGSAMQSNQNAINQISNSNVFRLDEEPDNNYHNVFPRAANSNPFPDIFRLSGDNVESLAFTVFDFYQYNNFWFGVNQLGSKPKDFKPTFSYNAYGTVRKTYTNGDSFENKIYSADGVTLKTGYKVNSKAFSAHQSNALSLGTSSNVWKDVFTQNAVTVVSDARYKTEISELNEQELQCAIACSKLYRKYKLNAAVDEKGLNSARYHIGVIAQEVVQCFTDHNLDWRKYGIITYEKWDAVEAGEIYMVRYDEFNSFVMAGQQARIDALEAI
ncbi:tail fiber domain-containing protein [Acinetobacter ursingii]|uniref:tail fiber domain-containing protein n=1 Tax=Acinetobacter ursingii TaxID=108980 RepID=UPI00124FD4F1|nr:tail fiber domain-containing protein [Acinetobacter ursingii]